MKQERALSLHWWSKLACLCLLLCVPLGALAWETPILVSSYETEDSGRIVRERLDETLSAALEIKRDGDFRYILLPDGTASLVAWDGTGDTVALPSFVGEAQTGVTGLGVPDMKLAVPLVPENCEISVWPEGLSRICGGAIALGSRTQFRIPEGVRELDAFAEKANYTLKRIELPETLEILGPRCFAYFMQMDRIVLPASLREIGTEAFMASEVSDIRLSTGLARVGPGSFYGCHALEEIALPESTLDIGTEAFAMCRNLQRCEVPGTVEKIGDRAFAGCTRLYGLILREGSLREIGEEAFQGLEWLRKLRVPSTVTHLGEGAFDGCVRLAQIDFPGNLESIGDHAFRDLPDEAEFLVQAGTRTEKLLRELGFRVRTP